ncbi:MAG: helix-hairpin-helix domain-containing protein [Verrucomicrobiales bacterium]
MAKQFGQKAASRTVELLEKPFTLHTTFANARGDVRFRRIYAFVTTAQSHDLASQLVREGLARAIGVSRQTPTGLHADAYREKLRDLELYAAKHGAGIWAITDWSRLPAERRLNRLEETELALATNSNDALQAGSIDPNLATRDELIRLPRIGEVTTNHIIEHHPYRTIDELQRVPSIGPVTFEADSPVSSAENACNHPHRRVDLHCANPLDSGVSPHPCNRSLPCFLFQDKLSDRLTVTSNRVHHRHRR